jgi:hypothetical protein
MQQIRHIAINRALGNIQPSRQERRSGESPPTDQLNDLKKAIGAAHECVEIDRLSGRLRMRMPT